MLKSFTAYKEDKQYQKYLLDVESQRQENISWFKENHDDIIENYPNQWIVMGFMEGLGYIGVKRTSHALESVLPELRMAQQLYPSDIIAFGAIFASIDPKEPSSPLILNVHPSSLQSFQN